MTRPRRSASILLACLSIPLPGLPGPVRAQVSEPGSIPGRLVIIGGALEGENQEVYRAVLEGRRGPGPMCVFPTASGVPEESMERAVEWLDAHGGAGTAMGIFLTTGNASDALAPGMAARIRNCSGFYFTGGSQSRIMDVFRPGGVDTPAYDALMERWRAGAVVAGTSAGAAMMSSRSIVGGNSAEALEWGLRSSDDGEGVRVRPGMDFVPWAVVDQHFLARGRWGRLLTAVVADPAVDQGVGIDENTALVVDGNVGEVVGASGVVWLDARGSAPDPERVTAEGLTLHLLGAGDRFSLATGVVERAPGREPLPSTPTSVEAPVDPFARWAFLHFLVAWSVSGQDEVTLGLRTRPITLTKGEGFLAVTSGPGGVEGTPAGFSAGPIRVTLGRN